jgi:hypothetical protein
VYHGGVPTLKLTSRALDNLPLPTRGRVEYFDEALPGFAVRIFPSGRRVFTLLYRMKGGRAKKKERVDLDRLRLELRGERPSLPLRHEDTHIRLSQGVHETGSIPASNKWGEWGPDIALVSLFPAAEGTIKRSKAFYNLQRRRADALTSKVRHQEGLWAALGGVGEQSTFGPDETIIQTTVFASTISGTAERDGHDYLELFINRDGKPSGYLPSSYGGISGSGLWRVDVRRSGRGGVFVPDDGIALEGLAFWEEPREGLHGFLRCHGRASIYGRMMDEMVAPSSPS